MLRIIQTAIKIHFAVCARVKDDQFFVEKMFVNKNIFFSY